VIFHFATQWRAAVYDSSMSKERDSKKRIGLVQLFAEGDTSAAPDEIQVVPTGKWKHPVYGEMEITPAHIAEFVQNFKNKVRLDIPINAGHDNGMSGGELRAIGWFTDAIDRGVNGLWCGVKWTEEGKQLLTQGAFKYFSPEFYEKYSDPETGKEYSHVLVGGALTNKPYFKELEPVARFSEPDIMNQINDDMKFSLQEILSKKPEELSADEKAFVKEHEAKLSDEQKTTFASAIEAPDPAPTPEPKPTPDPAPTPDPKEAKEPKGKQITMSEAEVDALRRAADDGQKALQKIEASERKALVGKLTFSSTNTEGRFLPKQEGALDNFLKTLSESQRDAFVQLVKNMPAADRSIFKEIGDGGSTESGDADSVANKVRSMVKEKIKASEGKLNFSAALLEVYAENPGLKAEYEKALVDSE
jgi:phage I-like protein